MSKSFSELFDKGKSTKKIEPKVDIQPPVTPAPAPPVTSNKTYADGFFSATVLFLILFGAHYVFSHGLLPSIPVIVPQANIFGEPGLHVLVVYESQSGMPRSLNGEVRQYLTEKVSKDKSGHPNFLFIDKDATFEADAELWKKVAARERKSVPWITIGSDKGNFEGPLPATPEATLDLLKKYGG